MAKLYVVEIEEYIKPLKETTTDCFKVRAITDVGALALAIDYLARDNQQLKKNYEAKTKVLTPTPKGVTFFDIQDSYTIKVIDLKELEEL